MLSCREHVDSGAGICVSLHAKTMNLAIFANTRMLFITQQHSLSPMLKQVFYLIHFIFSRTVANNCMVALV